MTKQEKINQYIFEICGSDQSKVDFVRTKSRKGEIVKARLDVCDKLTKMGFSVISIAENFSMDHSSISKGLIRFRNEIESKEISSKIIKVR